VVAFFVGIDRSNAATVALLLTRIVLPKTEWLSKLGVRTDWPMHGMPRVLHLDNAAEFKGRALQMGCAEYGVGLMYRPVGKPHFGGHIERLNRTLMERVHGLPGSTGSSPKGRKERRSEQQAALTLREFEQWLALEVGQRYHYSAHRGLLAIHQQADGRRYVRPRLCMRCQVLPMQPCDFCCIFFQRLAGRFNAMALRYFTYVTGTPYLQHGVRPTTTS
jgi:transposase InsO family protein